MKQLELGAYTFEADERLVIETESDNPHLELNGKQVDQLGEWLAELRMTTYGD